MNDLYFTAKNKKGVQGGKLSLQAYIFYIIKAEALYIIRNLLRYIINAEHCISSNRRKIHAGA